MRTNITRRGFIGTAAAVATVSTFGIVAAVPWISIGFL